MTDTESKPDSELETRGAPTWADFRSSKGRRRRPLVIGHRGAPLEQPENTLASFRRALEQGADVLETDIRITKDGEFVLIHDETVDRTTNGTGCVQRHSLEQLRQYHNVTSAGEVTEEEIPTLVELLTMTQGKAPLLLELKDHKFTASHYAQRLVDVLTAYGVMQRSAIVSFDMQRVYTMSNVCAELPTGLITFKQPLPRSGTALFGPAWPLLFVNPFYVAHAHRLGSIVAPLDTTPEKRMWYYLLLGVDALLTNSPRATIEALERHGRH